MLLMNSGKLIFLAFFASVLCNPERDCIDIENILLDDELCSNVYAYTLYLNGEQGKNCKKIKRTFNI